MQADQLAQFGEPDAFAVTRDLFEDREGAAERLDADPLPVVGVVVDIVLDGCTSLAMAALRRAAGLSLAFCLVRAVSRAGLSRGRHCNISGRLAIEHVSDRHGALGESHTTI